MQITGPALSTTLLVYGLGLASMSLWGTIECQPADLCSMEMCDNLDSCQSIAENLNTALSPYKSKSSGRYNMKTKALNSLELYTETRRHLIYFKGLSSVLDNYTTSRSYMVESRNRAMSAFTDLLKKNLSSLIAFTDRAVDDMAATLTRTVKSIDIEPKKTTIYSAVFEVSQMFKGMIKSWRQKCSKCVLKTSKKPKSRKRNCPCPTNAKGIKKQD